MMQRGQFQPVLLNFWWSGPQDRQISHSLRIYPIAHLNSLSEYIKFTQEVEVDGKLAFLDTLVTREADGSLRTSVYRKPTHTHQLLSFQSHHPLHQKLGVVKSLSRRARDISSTDSSLKAEKKVLSSDFKMCGYPDWAIQSGNAPANIGRVNTNQDKDVKGFMSIPYVKGVSEPISRILHSTGLEVAMRPCRTLRQSLVHPKDKDEDQDKAGVVYKIKCNDCDAAYVGHTGRHLRERMKEHRRAFEKGNSLESGVAEHAMTSGHSIDWKPEILDREAYQNRRLIKESLHIKQQAPSMNRETGIQVNKAYDSLIAPGGNTTPSSGREGHHCPAPPTNVSSH